MTAPRHHITITLPPLANPDDDAAAIARETDLELARRRGEHLLNRQLRQRRPSRPAALEWSI